MTLPARTVRMLRTGKEISPSIGLGSEALGLLLGVLGLCCAILIALVGMNGDQIGCKFLMCKELCPAAGPGPEERCTAWWSTFYAPGYVGGGTELELVQQQQEEEEAMENEDCPLGEAIEVHANLMLASQGGLRQATCH